MDTWIQTYTGKEFRLDRFPPDQFNMLDVAHALSHLCRYTGHTKHFYSVAEHCVYAYEVAPDELKRTALLHDLSEAYLGDMASPLKNMIQGYRDIEHALMLAASKVYDFHYPLPNPIKWIDIRLLQTERLALLGDEPKSWELDAIDPYDITIQCWDSVYAKQKFIQCCQKEGLL